jgi:hypothetical protein
MLSVKKSAGMLVKIVAASVVPRQKMQSDWLLRSFNSERFFLPSFAIVAVLA